MYPDIVEFICKYHGISKDSVLLLDHDIVGETCIYINGKWSGYVSEIISEMGENEE